MLLISKTQAQDWCTDAVKVRQRLERASGDPGEIEALISCQASAVPTAIALLKASDPTLRRTAAYWLGRIGAEAKAAVPALIATLQDENLMVRSTAADALVKIATALYESAETADQLSEAKTVIRSIQQALQDANFAVIKQPDRSHSRDHPRHLTTRKLG